MKEGKTETKETAKVPKASKQRQTGTKQKSVMRCVRGYKNVSWQVLNTCRFELSAPAGFTSKDNAPSELHMPFGHNSRRYEIYELGPNR